jgi:hypothetical protein
MGVFDHPGRSVAGSGNLSASPFAQSVEQAQGQIFHVRKLAVDGEEQDGDDSDDYPDVRHVMLDSSGRWFIRDGAIGALLDLPIASSGGT